MIIFNLELGRWLFAEILEELDPLLAPSVRAGTEQGLAWQEEIGEATRLRLSELDPEVASVLDRRDPTVADEISLFGAAYFIAEIFDRYDDAETAANWRAHNEDLGSVARRACLRMRSALAKLLACDETTVDQISPSAAWAALYSRWLFAGAIEPHSKELADALRFADTDTVTWFNAVCERGLSRASDDDTSFAESLSITDNGSDLELSEQMLAFHYIAGEVRASLDVELTIDDELARRVLASLRESLGAIAMDSGSSVQVMDA